MEENKKRGKVYMIFLPVVALYGIQTGVSLFMMQISAANLAMEKGPLTITELMKVVLDLTMSQDYIMFYTLIASFICFVIFLVWYRQVLIKDAQFEKVELTFSKPSYPMMLVGVVLVTVGAQYVLSFFAEVLIKLMPAWYIQYTSILDNAGLSAVGHADVPLATVLYVLIGAPLMEELLFRGLCLKYSLRCFGKWTSIIISSVLFALLHDNPLQSSATFLFALLLGYICVCTGRLWICILIHFLFNLMSLYMPKYITLAGQPVLDFVIMFTSMVAVYLGLKTIVRSNVAEGD